MYKLLKETNLHELTFQFNTWMNVSNIAYTTANIIIKEIFSSYKKGVDFTKKKINAKLVDEGIDEEKISRILDMVGKEDPFEKAREELESESKRMRFITKVFPCVEPETVVLSPSNSSVKDTYQYVPLRKSLKHLLEDEAFLKQKLNDPYHHDSNLIQDVRDGECYRENQFFLNNPEAVPLLLFQDELEVRS